MDHRLLSHPRMNPPCTTPPLSRVLLSDSCRLVSAPCPQLPTAALSLSDPVMKVSQEPRVCDGVPLHHIAVEIMCAAKGAGGQDDGGLVISLWTPLFTYLLLSFILTHTLFLLVVCYRPQICRQIAWDLSSLQDPA